MAAALQTRNSPAVLHDGAVPGLPGISAEALRASGMPLNLDEEESAGPAPEPTERFVHFYVKDQSYGVPVLRIQEVIRVSELASVPGAARQVIGVINLRGRIVPVISLRRLLGLPDGTFSEEAADEQRLVVVDVAREAIALLVDSVAGLVDVQKSSVESAPRVGSTAVPITGVVTSAEEVFVLLDIDALVALARPAKLEQ